MKRATVKKQDYVYTSRVSGKEKIEERWFVYWTDPVTRKRKEDGKFRNKRHADAFAAKIDREIDEGSYVADADSVTVGKAVRAWLEYNREKHTVGGIAGNTLKNYEWAAQYMAPRAWLEYRVKHQVGRVSDILKNDEWSTFEREWSVLERTPLNKINHDNVEKWVFQLKATKSRTDRTFGKPLEVHSVKNIYQYFLKLLAFAIRSKKMGLRRNPLRDDPVKVPGKNRKPVLPDTMSEDIEKLMRFMSGPKHHNRNFLGWYNDKIAFYLCAFSGLRRGEASALRWENVDLPGARFKVIDKEGNNSAIDGLKVPKSEAGVRSIPIPQILYDELLDHIHNTGSQEGFIIKNAKNPDSPKPPHPEKISESHRQMMRDAGLVKADGKTPRFHLHALRHWYGSMQMRLGINLMNISKRIGHARPSTTTDMYGHVLDGDEDGLKEDVNPIWRERFARANPGLPRLIEGTVDSSTLIELEATEVSSVVIPDNAMPWVPEAVRLLNGGWRVSDVAKHLGRDKATIAHGFNRAGMAPPSTFVKAARERRYQDLHDKGYGDAEIGRLTNTSHVTVINWRRCMESGKPSSTKSLKELKKERKEVGTFSGKLLEKQPKML